MRVERLIDLSHSTALDAVFTGRLTDADGTPIGVGSRRQQVPAVLSRGPDGTRLSAGPLQVDLLGLSVSLPVFTFSAEDCCAADLDPRAREAGR